MDTFRKRSNAHWLMAYSLCIMMVGPNLPSPLYELYRRNWHLSAGMITLLFATYPLVLLPFLLMVGSLVDRIGHRKIIVSGLFIAVAGSTCFALAHVGRKTPSYDKGSVRLIASTENWPQEVS